MLTFADATTFWTALGAIGSMAAAAVAVLIAFTLTRRQTDLSERAAANARVSAEAAVEATRVAAAALEVSSQQLEVARAELRLAQKTSEAATEAALAAVRPWFSTTTLRWRGSDRTFLVRGTNSGKGPGMIVGSVLTGPGHPPAFTAHGSPSRLASPGEEIEVTVGAPPGLADLPTGTYRFTATVVAAGGTDPRNVAWEFSFEDTASIVETTGRLSG